MLLFVGFSLLSQGIFDPDAIAMKVAGASPGVKLAFFFAAVAFTALGLPRQLVAFVCGYVFGIVPGLLVSLAAAVLGCIAAFWVARAFLREPISRRFSTMVETLDGLVQHDAFLKIIVLRIQPLGTNLLTNLCAGVSGIRPLPFFASTALGYLPQMIVFALAGDGIRLGDQSKLVLSAVLFVISLLLAFWLWRRHQARTGQT